MLSLYLAPMLGMSGTIPLLTPIGFHGVDRDKSALFCLCIYITARLLFRITERRVSGLLTNNG